MPELPEVETVVRRLKEILPGKRFAKFQQFHQKSFVGDSNLLINSSVSDVTRRAKFINIHLDNNLHLLTHLKMTGQLIFSSDDGRVGGGHPTADWVAELPSKHTRIMYEFNDNSKLFFNDQRIFGWMKLLTPEQIEYEYARYGLDINAQQLQMRNVKLKIINKIKKSRRAIKQVILDQNIIAGLGNIYACEALWLAKIDPQRPANSLSQLQLVSLIDHSIAVINHAIKLGGTTFDGKYVDTAGFAGAFQNELKVYGQEGSACKRCGNLIKKIKLGGRGTYYCSGCQL